MVAATPGNPQILKRKITGFGIGLQACATGWQRPGKLLFLLGPGWNTREGKGPFHARATAQNRAQKKEFPLRNADHKKALPPGQKKPAFPAGLYSWRSWTLWGKSLVYARANCRKVPHRKQSSKHRGLGTTVNHVTIVRGESVRNCGHKKARGSGFTPPLPLAAGCLPRGPAWGRFSNSGGFCCKGGSFTRCRFPLQKEKGRGTMSTTP